MKKLLEITKNNIWYATVFFQNIILYLAVKRINFLREVIVGLKGV